MSILFLPEHCRVVRHKSQENNSYKLLFACPNSRFKVNCSDNNLQIEFLLRNKAIKVC